MYVHPLQHVQSLWSVVEEFVVYAFVVLPANDINVKSCSIVARNQKTESNIQNVQRRPVKSTEKGGIQQIHTYSTNLLTIDNYLQTHVQQDIVSSLPITT